MLFFDKGVPWGVNAGRGVQGWELSCVEYEEMWKWSVELLRREGLDWSSRMRIEG